MMNISSLTNISKHFLELFICKGDCVIDATAGNGNDTLFLSKLVGNDGQVFSFDIQKEAIINTQLLLSKHNVSNVILYHCSNENVDIYVKEKIKGAMFNLGYLPNGKNKNIITSEKNTIVSLKKIVLLLLTGGIISVICYRAHNGGEQEYNLLLEYLKELDNKQFEIIKYDTINTLKKSPILFLIKKK